MKEQSILKAKTLNETRESRPIKRKTQIIYNSINKPQFLYIQFSRFYRKENSVPEIGKVMSRESFSRTEAENFEERSLLEIREVKFASLVSNSRKCVSGGSTQKSNGTIVPSRADHSRSWIYRRASNGIFNLPAIIRPLSILGRFFTFLLRADMGKGRPFLLDGSVKEDW